MRRSIPIRRHEGQASRQAHVGLPEGTFERELGRDGFFGPASHMYHRHPPTGWTSWEGPLRPRAFDLNKLASTGGSPFEARPVLANGSVAVHLWRCETSMDHLARNADGDELVFVHRGAGELFCDYGHLAFEAGDYIVLPRSTMWRIEPSETVTALLVQATNNAYRLPDRGIAGQHAVFDPDVLDTPAIDEAFLAQQDETPWRVVVKRRDAALDRDLPLQSARRGGLEGRPAAGAAQRARHPADHEPPLPPAALGPLDLRRRPLRRLHLRAAPVRDRPGGAEGAVLPQQRRLRRGHLLSRRRLLQPRQHRCRHDDLPPVRVSPMGPIPRRWRTCWCRRSRRPTKLRS